MQSGTPNVLLRAEEAVKDGAVSIPNGDITIEDASGVLNRTSNIIKYADINGDGTSGGGADVVYLQSYVANGSNKYRNSSISKMAMETLLPRTLKKQI